MSTIRGRDVASIGARRPGAGSRRDAAGATPVPAPADVRRARRLMLVLLFAFYLVTLLGSQSADYFLQDPDIYWHIAVGRDIWRTGAFPQLDAYSFTFQGHPWIANQWLGELFLSGAYSLAGWRGVVLLTALAIALSYSLLFLFLSRQMRLTAAAGIATLAYSFSLGHFSARPQIFADPLLILWVAGLVHAVENRIAPSWLLFPSWSCGPISMGASASDWRSPSRSRPRQSFTAMPRNVFERRAMGGLSGCRAWRRLRHALRLSAATRYAAGVRRQRGTLAYRRVATRHLANPWE